MSELAAEVSLAAELIRRPSVTPEDAGCQELLRARLAAAGFRCTQLDHHRTRNLWAVHGTGGPLLVFTGHTDVVPPGERAAWSVDPFAGVVQDGMLWGRGAVDMKGALAAAVIAAEHFVAAVPEHRGTLAFLVTSDEEGDGEDGIRRVLPELLEGGWRLNAALVGEPTARQRVGDTARSGRRGSLSVELVVRGRQGHVAYPERVDNPIAAVAPLLAACSQERWDPEPPPDSFPPTSFQWVAIQADAGAGNVVPGRLRAVGNFRYAPGLDAEGIAARFATLVEACGLSDQVATTWTEYARPFLTPPGPLRRAVTEAVRRVTGVEPTWDNGGGTSDGRFLAAAGAEVVELGLPHATAHQVDEHVAIAELVRLRKLYSELFRTYLTTELVT